MLFLLLIVYVTANRHFNIDSGMHFSLPTETESGILSGVGWDSVFGQEAFWLCFRFIKSRFWSWQPGGAAGKLLEGENKKMDGGRKGERVESKQRESGRTPVK